MWRDSREFALTECELIPESIRCAVALGVELDGAVFAARVAAVKRRWEAAEEPSGTPGPMDVKTVIYKSIEILRRDVWRFLDVIEDVEGAVYEAFGPRSTKVASATKPPLPSSD